MRRAYHGSHQEPNYPRRPVSLCLVAWGVTNIFALLQRSSCSSVASHSGNSVERLHIVVWHQVCITEGIMSHLSTLWPSHLSGWAKSPYSLLWDCCHPAVMWALRVQVFVLFTWSHFSQRHLLLSPSFPSPWFNLDGYTYSWFSYA